jgi:hypothetical protein
MDGWMEGWVGGWVGGWVDGWTDGRTDGWMDGWTVRWTDSHEGATSCRVRTLLVGYLVFFIQIIFPHISTL